MRPKCEPEQPQREMFQIDLEQVIDLDHPLVRLGLSIDWSSLEETVGDTYHPSHVGRRLPMQSSRYAHAGQMKRAGACTRKLKTQLGRIVREIERQVETPSNKLRKLLRTAHRIHAQQRHDKNKIYSVHEPEVQCIANVIALLGGLPTLFLEATAATLAPTHRFIKLVLGLS